LFVLQEELAEIAGFLSEQYKCSDLKKYIRAVWFDLLESLTREKIPVLSIFTTERSRFSEISKGRDTSKQATVQIFDDSVI